MNAKLRVGALALAVALAACSQKAQDHTANAVTDIGSDIDNFADNTVDAAGDALNPTPTGQEFADKAAKSDAFEIAVAKLAQKEATSTDVKKFAADMIKAHTDSTAKVKAAAASASPAITPNPDLTEDQAEKLADLGKLKGADFDKAYIDGQVDAHEDALSLMQNYAKDGEVASLKAAAGDIAPVVQKHLDMAKALNK